MSIASAITAAQGRVADCYTAISNKGGTLPATQNLTNMPTAINSIPSGSTPTLITKTITQNGTYNASSDNADGYSSVTVNVSGGGGYTELPSYQVSNGVASRISKVLDGTEFSNITSINSNAFQYAYFKCTGLSGNLDLSNLVTIGNHGLLDAFYGCTGITSVDLSSLTTVSEYGLGSAFYECYYLTEIDLSNLSTIDSNGLSSAFRGCSRLSSVDLSSLTSVNTSGLYQTFYQNGYLSTISFSSLNTINGQMSFYQAFYGCSGLTDIYFNSLTTTSFGSYKNQFQNMLSSTGKSVRHTLHFPSNLQSTISGLTGYPTFGGTSGYVVCAFDLTATS